MGPDLKFLSVGMWDDSGLWWIQWHSDVGTSEKRQTAVVELAYASPAPSLRAQASLDQMGLCTSGCRWAGCCFPLASNRYSLCMRSTYPEGHLKWGNAQQRCCADERPLRDEAAGANLEPVRFKWNWNPKRLIDVRSKTQEQSTPTRRRNS